MGVEVSSGVEMGKASHVMYLISKRRETLNRATSCRREPFFQEAIFEGDCARISLLVLSLDSDSGGTASFYSTGQR